MCVKKETCTVFQHGGVSWLFCTSTKIKNNATTIIHRFMLCETPTSYDIDPVKRLYGLILTSER